MNIGLITSLLKERVRNIAIAATIAVLAGVGLAPLLIIRSASASQLTLRSIKMDNSKANATDVKYTVSFTTATTMTNVADTGGLEGIVIEFCKNNPLVGQACTAPTNFDTNKANLVLANQTGITGFTIHANTDDNTVIITNATGATVNSGTAVSFDLGVTAGATNDGIENPDSEGINTFYARILTYNDSANAAAYAPTTEGSYTDDGGIALQINNQLTISARVQEMLQFCVGTTYAASAGNAQYDGCLDTTGAPTVEMSGTQIDLGTLDFTAINTTAANAGKAMVRTNATNGVSIDYYAQQAAGTNHKGSLRVPGASCNAGNVSNDQCINSAGTTATTFTAGQEKFGMTATAVNTSYSYTPTGVLVRDDDYNVATEYAWQEDGQTTEQIASAPSPVDDEMLELKFAATPNLTTPAGAYSVTATFVATATF